MVYNLRSPRFGEASVGVRLSEIEPKNICGDEVAALSFQQKGLAQIVRQLLLVAVTRLGL